MSWKLLPTDYTDAIWAGLKKYIQVDNSDGTVSFQDVTAYSQKEKSFFGAKDANRMNEAMNILMSMAENGTDLYQLFQDYFAQQKELFAENADAELERLIAYLQTVKAEGDKVLEDIKTDYTEDIGLFKEHQQEVFNVWFRAIQDKLSENTAGKLTNDIELLKMEKQDKITGEEGQIAGFDRDGNITAQNPTFTAANTLTALISGEKLSAAFGKLAKAVADLISHLGSKSNPHGVTAAQVGARPDTWTPTAQDVGALPISGGTLTGNLTLKGSGAYGTKINLGDGDYVHIAEPTDDCLEIKAKRINFVVSDTSNLKFTLNGKEIGGSTFEANAAAHNSIYRGKYLGNTVTSAQYAAISAGTFDDLFIGDYWTIENVNYRIAAFDYYLKKGSSVVTTHHAVIIPDTTLDREKMEDSATTSNGYCGTKMYTENIQFTKSLIKRVFSNHIMQKSLYLYSGAYKGVPYRGQWVTSDIELMSELMVYGTHVQGPYFEDPGNVTPGMKTLEPLQFPLFFYEPSRICSDKDWWLRDTVTDKSYALVGADGFAMSWFANDMAGIRPSFCIS